MPDHRRLRAIALGFAATVLATTGTVTANSPALSHVTSPNTAASQRQAIPAGYVSLRIANLNSNFSLTSSQWRGQMNKVGAYAPDVILIQEVQWRDRDLTEWAKRNRYRLLWPKTNEKQESTVLLRDNGRFDIRDTNHRAGSPRLRRANGDYISARYIATVRVVDKKSGRRLAFSSTHAVPEVMWWPSQVDDDGAPNPFQVQPRYGTATLAGFRQHMRAVRTQFVSDQQAGYRSIVGGDFNTGVEYESQWEGFQTRAFGDLAQSNHQALGARITHTEADGSDPRSIDYVYARRGPMVKFVQHRVVEVPSDHHLMVVDLAVDKR